MESRTKTARSWLSTHLLKLFGADADRAAELLGEFLKQRSYRRDYALRLLAAARGEAGDAWEIRRLATLMIEHQVLQIPVDDLPEFDLLLTHLNLKSAGANAALKGAVLKEGYSTTELRGFVAEFRCRLGRLNRVHDRINGTRSARRALRDFLGLAQRDCKLTLARYLFSPAEVVERILAQVRLTRGVPDLDPFEPPHIAGEIEQTIAALPDFEASLLRRLCAVGKVCWVADATSSELNSLVEYPLGTVVLVIKPPGSQIEFEIKRAGRRGSHPLGVVHWRKGAKVPPSHRLDGGSMQVSLRWEAEMGAKFAAIYRLAHGAPAPLSQSISRISIYNVPAAGGEARLLDYFTSPRVFGADFPAMRAALKETISSFDNELGAHQVAAPGALGLTARFLMHVAPTQGCLSGSSSFRLDRLAAYLSAAGPESYFGAGLKSKYGKQDARQLADELLDEVLGVYRPPPVNFRSYEQYLEAAFAVPENQRRAARNFLAALGQIGSVWGTLWAVRGSSTGESFVARNVGLRSVWTGGEWGVRLQFMDHDSLQIHAPADGQYQWLSAPAELATDETFILGLRDGDRRVIGEVDCLETIYRVGPELRQAGQAVFRQQMAEAYRQTQRAVETKPELQKLFHASFIKRARDLDLAAAGYLKVRPNSQGVAAWRQEMTGLFGARGYEPGEIAAHLAIVEKHADFLARYAFLY